MECLISLQHLAKNDGFLEELFNVIEFELHNACLTASSSQYLLTPVIMHLSPEDAISMITQFSPSAGQDDVNHWTAGEKKVESKGEASQIWAKKEPRDETSHISSS